LSEITKTEKTTEKTASRKMGSRQFFVALFSYHVNFRCRIFLLPNFPVAISSVAVFSVALFSVAVISHINFVLPCFPTLSFFVADFSYCPIFR